MSTNDYLLSEYGDPVARLMRHNHHETNSRQGGAIHFLAGQNVDRLLAANHADAEIDQRKQIFEHVARVPLVIWEQAIREGWDDDPAAWKKWLRDPANAPFLIKPGRV